MIFGNLAFHNRYNFLNESLQKCFKYVQENDLKALPTGVYQIEGDDIFVNIVEYTTTTPENRFWETHRTYIDLHLMIDGLEQIDLNFLDNMTQKEYVAENDFLPLEGTLNSMTHLSNNDFLILYPEDAHRTGVQVDAPQSVKKAIFKIRVDY